MESHDQLNIIRNIIHHSSISMNLGVMNGTAGAIIFLYHYSKFSNENIYADLAGILLDDLFEDMYYTMDLSFNRGLPGIGWGIEYILKNNFVEGESYEILEDIDKAIMSWDIKRLENETFESGLEGIFHYILYHLPIHKTLPCPFDAAFMEDLDHVTFKVGDNSKNKNLQELISQYISWRNGNTLQYNPLILLRNLLSFSPEDLNYQKYITTGLDKGYAGLGLKLMGF